MELTETIKPLVEDNDGKKSFYITGPFMQADLLNRNGRIYPKGVMESAVNKYITEKVQNKSAYGELGHPNGPKINEDRISHLITELKWDKNYVYGKAKVFDTPMGSIVKSVIDGGGNLGVSTRGLGSLKMNKENVNVVQDDFFLSTAADIVTDPSSQKAWVSGVMENIEWLYDESNGEYFMKKLDETKKTLKKMSLNEIEEKGLSLFESFIKTIVNKQNK